MRIEWKPEEGKEYMRVPLEPDGRGYERVHLFSEREVEAINFALATARPLLILGEPGTGKSQLAEAAAEKLEFAFRRRTVNAATEPEELLYDLDLVERLAEAQIAASLYPLPGKDGSADDAALARRRELIRGELSITRFLRPGVLWEGFDPVSARERLAAIRTASTSTGGEASVEPKDGRTKRGVVVLIDEIDKADPSVPNALLDALGRGAFEIPGGGTIRCGHQPPLVIVTSNKERELPRAFLRRCLVLHLSLPDREGPFVELMRERAAAHLEAGKAQLARERAAAHLGADREQPGLALPGDPVLEEAARLLWSDRQAAERDRESIPGQAELIDLAWALARLLEDDQRRLERLGKMSRFVFDKHGTRPSPRRKGSSVEGSPSSGST